MSPDIEEHYTVHQDKDMRRGPIDHFGYIAVAILPRTLAHLNTSNGSRTRVQGNSLLVELETEAKCRPELQAKSAYRAERQ